MGFGHRQSVRLCGRALTRQTTKDTQTIMLASRQQLFDILRQIQPTATHDWVVFLGYEFYRWCDEAFALPETSNTVDLYLLECKQWHSIDCPWPMVPQPPIRVNPLPTDYLQQFSASFSEQEFAEAVEEIQNHIQAGELYQANLSLSLTHPHSDPATALSIFDSLCRENPSPYMGFLKTEAGTLISNSPERLVRRTDCHLETRPIAGTRGRGVSAFEDQSLGESLLQHPKERAEHLMLVDLLRNDLGRVCEAGSVCVNELLCLERYSHVTHLVSNVIGNVSKTTDVWQIIRALFPGGTITGCPKIRCIELLDALEPVPRGFYTGSLGYLSPDGLELDLNILIRSLFLGYNGCRLHVGAGIVADSVPAHEYRECFRKAQALLGALFNVTQQH